MNLLFAVYIDCISTECKKYYVKSFMYENNLKIILYWITYRRSMFTLHVKSIEKKHNEDHVFKDLEQVRRCLNQNYFQGLDIVKKNTLYSIASRPSTLKNCPYRDFITIQKVTKTDAWDIIEQFVFYGRLNTDHKSF